MKSTPDKDCEYKDVICDAILIQFEDALTGKGDYPIPLVIPDVGDVKDLIVGVVYEICGMKNGYEMDFYNANIVCSQLESPKALSKRLLDGLTEVIWEGSSDCWLRMYMWESRFYNHWYCGKGQLFTYKDKDEAVKRVRAYFTEEELEQIARLGRLMRDELAEKIKGK